MFDTGQWGAGQLRDKFPGYCPADSEEEGRRLF